MKINEIYYSLQGEGIFIGLPSIFIRITGCNLRCKWCDTKYAYEKGDEMEFTDILNNIRMYPTRYVCITGGEPLDQEDTPRLVDMILDEGYEICLETNGSISIEGLPKKENLIISLDIKCPSSGMQDKMYFSNLEMLEPKDQLKFIIEDEKDYEYAKGILNKYYPKGNIIMIPVYGSNIKSLADWVLKDNLDVRVLPQLHKMIWGEMRST
jgi:7-carboxy-7-deazaguanine synthase